MSRSYAPLLAALAILSAPATAFADCPSSMSPPTRLNCLNTALNAAVTTITALQTANDDLEAQLAALDDEVANISADYLVSGDLDDYTTFDYVDSLVWGIPNLGDYLSVDTATDSIVFTGANVYVQSGSGSTEGAVNGLGNLVVGYNDASGNPADPVLDRSGSHNLVIGSYNSYSSYGSFVMGFGNTVGGPYSSVCGGTQNHASGVASAVSGGSFNEARGYAASVIGGLWNLASGDLSSVSGGTSNVAAGDHSSVLGGNSVTVSTTDGHSP